MADDPTLEPELAEIEALLRELEPDDITPEAPPTHVWEGIEAELADDATSAGGTVVRPMFGRPRSWSVMALSAAAAIVVVIAGVAVLRSDSSATTLAEAELAFDAVAFDPLGAEAIASAALLDDDGDQLIEIADESLPFDLDEDAALELWLIQADADGNVVDLVSLGDIDPDGSRSFEVPAGYDPDVFSVVDISIEPRDGDRTHSGRSILRGALSA
jgi:anti-sigma-K factor RskA